jgi:hypothetical protein
MGATYRDPGWFATVDVPFAAMKSACKTVGIKLSQGSGH